jgi:hypothetical protein
MTIYRGSDTVGGGVSVASPEEITAARLAAEASATASAVSAAEALVSEGLADADAIYTAADVVLTNADVVLTHADVVLTHADVVLTNADVVSSGTNATTATTQAGIATTQAGNAATSASEAAASALTIPTYPTLSGNALNFVRLASGESAMEFQTPAQVLSGIGAEPADATILKDVDIGVSVQAYDATTVLDADLIASNITNTPAGNIAATNVQAAINELDVDKVMATTGVVTAGQNWSGVSLTGAALTAVGIIGTTPVATIYPDGSIVGSSSNGSFTVYPNGDIVARGSGATGATGSTIPYPIQISDPIVILTSQSSAQRSVQLDGGATTVNFPVAGYSGASDANVNFNFIVMGR